MLAKTTEFIQSQHTLLFTIIEQNLFKRNRFHITLYILTPKLLFKYKSIIFCMLTGNNSGHQDFIVKFNKPVILFSKSAALHSLKFLATSLITVK